MHTRISRLMTKHIKNYYSIILIHHVLDWPICTMSSFLVSSFWLWCCSTNWGIVTRPTPLHSMADTAWAHMAPSTMLCLHRRGECKEMILDYTLTPTPGRFQYQVLRKCVYLLPSVNPPHYVAVWIVWMSFQQGGGRAKWTPMWFTPTTMSMH